MAFFICQTPEHPRQITTAVTICFHWAQLTEKNKKDSKGLQGKLEGSLKWKGESSNSRRAFDTNFREIIRVDLLLDKT